MIKVSLINLCNSINLVQVLQARKFQHKIRGKLNSQLRGLEIEEHCCLEDSIFGFLAITCEKLNMSARAYHRVLRLALTIVDIEKMEHVTKAHLLEALSFRSLDRG